MRFLFSVLALFFWSLATQAVLVNVTVDDTAGDSLTGALVTYTPPDAWNSQANCNNKCEVHPDITKLDGPGTGTWHDSTFSVDPGNPHPNVPLTASISFNGSAVYVFCALSRSTTAPPGNSDMTFYLDGVAIGAFTKAPLGTAGFDYHVPVYANTAIPPGQHTFTLQNGHQNGPTSLMILDSIVYSYDDGAPTSSQDGAPAAESASASAGKGSSHSATLAVAGVLISALVLLLAGLAVFLYRRRRRRRAVYGRYMPKGAVQAFPSFISPTPASTPTRSLAPLPPVYAGGGGGRGGYGSGGDGNWWTGRDQKSRDGIGAHRPYADLDPAQAGLQRPQRWEHSGGGA
ncbi:hypothetical protein C8R44DRAFT_727686 [Mycena epipterygia]|nr:hypothetical protein C8R44DRAFT_727686 [Mycena epipterygia]